MINIEQVENLRKHADVTYQEAKAVLEATNGDMLEAIILLENQGKLEPPTNNGRFSTGDIMPAEPYKSQGETNGDYEGKGCSFSDQLSRFWQVICRIVHKGNTNNFEVMREGRNIMSIPVTLLVLSLLFLFWITLPVMIIGLFFGCAYRFSGPDLGKESINNVMDNASEKAESIKKSFKEESKNKNEYKDTDN